MLLQPQTRLPSSQNWLPAPFLLPAAARNSPMLFCPKSPPPSPSDFSFPAALRFFFQTHTQNQSALVLGIKTPLRSSLSSRNPLQKNLFLSLYLSAAVPPCSLASPAFFFSGFFLSIFPGKPSPASLFQQSAAWLLLQLVPRMERGPPTLLGCCQLL